MNKNPSGTPFDFAANRKAQKYSFGEQLRRVAWSFGRLFIRLSPRPAFCWRRMILRDFGAKVGNHVHIYPSTSFYMPWNVELGDWTSLGENVFIYSLGKVQIGEKVTLSYRTHLCAGSHDLNDPHLPLIKPPIKIADGVWIGTDAFIGPGVCIGKNAIVGARAVVTKDVAELNIVAGNPAKIIGRRNIN